MIEKKLIDDILRYGMLFNDEILVMEERIRSLSEKAKDLFFSGRFEEGYECIYEACKLAERLYGKEHPHYAAILCNFGFFLYQTRQHNKALNYCERSKEIFEKVEKTTSMDYILCLNNLATIYASLGLNDKALRIYESLLCLVNDKGGLEYATTLTNVGSQHRHRQQYSEALDFLEKARIIYVDNREINNPDYCAILNHIGLCYVGLRKYNVAIIWFSKTLEILKDNQNENGPFYLATLNNLALSFQHSGQIDIAIEIYSYLMQVSRSTLGEDHQDITNIIDNYSDILIQQDDFMKAIELINDSAIVNDRFIHRFFSYISSNEINFFINKFRYHIDILFSLLYSSKEPQQQCIDIAYNFIFRRRALVFNSEKYRQQIIETEKDGVIKKDLERLKCIKSEIAQMKYFPLEKNVDETHYLKILQQLEDESNRLERSISYNLSGLDKFKSLTEGNIFVRKKLPIDAALVEFVRYTHCDLKLKIAKTQRYAVFVGLCDENIQLFDLGPAQEIDDIILDVIKHIEPNHDEVISIDESPSFDNLNQMLDILGEKLLTIILPLISHKQHLFIVPDGLLHLLPFSILRNKEGYLIEQHSISYLTSSRDLSGHSSTSSHNQSSPVIIADPDYDLYQSDCPSLLSSETRDQRYLWESLDYFSSLEGTRTEGMKIHQAIGGELLLGRDALKISLMELSSPKILHIATHGFFLEGTRDQLSGWDSLVRSGLVLAGVNSYLSGHSLPKEVGNGIVTAYEVSGINLESTDLVVLSACETGVGDIIFGEGVFGFRRAFAIAGARTLAMSLWSIPDDQTEDLMVSFYSFLKFGKGKASALREAQLEIKEQYPHPYYWGSFIIQGDIKSINW